jgi:hypothetical protein
MNERDDALLEQILVSVRVTEEMAGEIKELVSGRIDDRIAIARDIAGLQADENLRVRPGHVSAALTVSWREKRGCVY